MAAKEVVDEIVQDLMAKYSFYQESMTPFMRIKTKDINELKQIYQMIKTKFLENTTFRPEMLYICIDNAYKYNNLYLSSYWFIFKMIYEDFKITPKNIIFDPILHYFFYKEYGILLDEKYRERF